MNWTNFPLFASSATVLWILGMILLNFSGKRKAFEIFGNILIVAGLAVLVAFLTILWINLDRPPLRTLGETRLWYSVFLPLIGIITYFRWGYKWFITYSLSARNPVPLYKLFTSGNL